MRALVAAAADFAAVKPWEYMCDCDVVGLMDPVANETRIGCVLGNAGEVFGAVFYRRASGLRWIMKMLDSPADTLNGDAVEGLDALKVEFVPKREISKADLAVLNALNFRPSGKGCVWPQFQSAEPGWLPWFVNQKEAEQMLVDLPRLTLFSKLVREHLGLFADRTLNEVPFLPDPMPGGPLRVEDLNWRPLIAPPESCVSFQANSGQLAQLGALPRVPKSAYEYDCSIAHGGAVLQNGRPCYSRISLLVEHRRGILLGFELGLGIEPLTESTGRGLLKLLLKNGFLPQRILIPGLRLQPVLEQFCNALQIELKPSERLPSLEEAMASLDQFMQHGPF
jgi:hypothetical protein